ncbi:hypothetical protein Ahy_B10g105717 [Arachis hypogaea]|uniref:MULE transposase domain-containing protein n=1 Tax=Arachis hypogaea TaxID=3818 RepID=A0A444X926_ARAHY|nr:hypothetical protein Ahy_B10g105717 [Arachis hypogaea]
MSSCSGYLVVSVYPNCHMRNNDNEVIFECENPILLCTPQSLILSGVGGSGRKEIGNVRYRLLAPIENGVFRFRLFYLHGDEHMCLLFDIHGRNIAEQVMKLFEEVGDVGGSGSGHSDFLQDDPLLIPKSIHVPSPIEDMDVDGEDSDEEYVADSNKSGSSKDDEEEEFVPETLVEPSPYSDPVICTQSLSYIGSRRDARKKSFSNTGEDNYNLAWTVVWSFELVTDSKAEMQSIKVPRALPIISSRLPLKSLCCSLTESRILGGALSGRSAHMFSAHHVSRPSTVGQQSLLPCHPTIDIIHPILKQSYHFKPLYRKVWMAKQKAITQIYGGWEESYNRVARLLQALQSCCPRTICDISVVPYYDGNFMVRDCSIFDKVFWAFPACVEAFKHCKPFVSVDGTHLYSKYGGVLLIVVAQDSNSNILPIAFAIVESEMTESWSFFLTNLRRHVTLQEGLLIIDSKRSRLH